MKYKEYLCKTDDGYILQTLPEHAGSGLIEVPEGAEILIQHGDNKDINFFKNNYEDMCSIEEDDGWISAGWGDVQGDKLEYMQDNYGSVVLWQRQDQVNHPSHYTNGKVECIDALESATVGKIGIEAVCVANVIKYLWRYEDKNGIEDVRKAQWYLNRLLSAMGD